MEERVATRGWRMRKCEGAHREMRESTNSFLDVAVRGFGNVEKRNHRVKGRREVEKCRQGRKEVSSIVREGTAGVDCFVVQRNTTTRFIQSDKGIDSFLVCCTFCWSALLPADGGEGGGQEMENTNSQDHDGDPAGISIITPSPESKILGGKWERVGILCSPPRKMNKRTGTIRTPGSMN